MRTLTTLLLTSCLLYAGCRSQPEPEDRTTWSLQPAGTIVTVRAAERYVIFHSHFAFRNRQDLQVVRDGKVVARLKLHKVSRPPFYTADVIQGQVRRNDIVETLPSLNL